MAFYAKFCTFSKRENSTKLFSGTYTDLSVELKDDCSVVEPILRLHNSANWNPSAYNYCYIPEFNRYYFVKDWDYALGEWNCYLTCDVLASFKTEIGNQTKFILRSSYEYDRTMIDSFYPAKFSNFTIHKTYDFGFDIDNGSYVIGIVNRDDKLVGGATSFYKIPNIQLNRLLRYMYPTAQDTFSGLNSITMDVVRSVIDPWQWITSCRKFPIAIPAEAEADWHELEFGQWKGWTSGETPVYGGRLLDSTNWPTLSTEFTIADDWLTRDAKYRSEPYIRICLLCNPWGFIELSPKDLAETATIRVTIEPDFITGDAILKVYKVVSAYNAYQIAQKTANISVETQFKASAINTNGLIGGAANALIGGASLAAGAGVTSALITAGGVIDASTSGLHSSTMNMGVQGGFRGIDGICELFVYESVFPVENNSEFGKPLFNTRTISNIPGFIKCADGEHDVSAYSDEKKAISIFMSEGFFYE